ncbi:hypothetical protein GCM10007852_25610 [Agaribacter marinus]|uniref:Uncharacterized protein n=2 Tax=Agaribacter marinus TaxID=1431249 RepID=A0AA37SXH8_9ALTE|nr:hypothetical protein GCM10007852_25610 [Agaribacter marinus]
MLKTNKKGNQALRMTHRPLIKHIRDHDALFTELALLRNGFASSIGLNQHAYHKVPKFVAPDGRRLTIEPERSIIVPNYKDLKNVKTLLEKNIAGFSIINGSDIGFRYPTAAIAGLDAPYIKRFRSEFFHRVDENRSICRPLNLSVGIKSRGKGDNREEYEVWVPDEYLAQDPTPLFIEKYGEDLPDEIREFAGTNSYVYGWMGVKRAAFEAIYTNTALIGDLAIVIGLSVDAYNIGARPDLSYSPIVDSSIAVGNAEFEWEVMGFYEPKGAHTGHDQIWQAIELAIEAVDAPLRSTYTNLLPIQESKTERILSTINSLGVSEEEIKALNLKPWEFLETESEHRRKANDPSRTVNLLGRLNRLFYQTDHHLPSLKEIHDLIV